MPDPERVAITLPVEDGLPAADYVGLAELAERCGYDAVLAGEVGWPVFSLLGLTTLRPDGRGFRSSRARVPVSRPTAPGRTRSV